MAEETKTLRHTAEEIDNAIDKLPAAGNAAGIYKIFPVFQFHRK